MATTTRTLNPLPFGDLEPHRFEDLVRQLAYDFQNWRSLEATGRSGSDEGIDIRGFERTSPEESPDSEEREDDIDSSGPDVSGDRLWVIQCKREKTIGPEKIKGILKHFISEGGEVPYGYVLAAACDFSLKTRREAGDILRQHKVQEMYLWGKGELEDMLFQPKNDHLLFAYFGISLQVRRRSMRTELRSKLTLKRKLAKELGGLQGTHYKSVLVRDPRDETYPFFESAEEFIKRPPWMYFEFQSHEPPDHLSFITGKFYAYVNWDTEEWDIIEEDAANLAIVSHPQIWGLGYNAFDPQNRSHIARAWWEMHVPEENRGFAIKMESIEYERILVCDELGDRYHEGPHLLVEYINGWPFSGKLKWIESEDDHIHSGRRVWWPKEEKRIVYFPKPLPDETEHFREYLRKRAEERNKDKRTGA